MTPIVICVAVPVNAIIGCLMTSRNLKSYLCSGRKSLPNVSIQSAPSIMMKLTLLVCCSFCIHDMNVDDNAPSELVKTNSYRQFACNRLCKIKSLPSSDSKLLK